MINLERVSIMERAIGFYFRNEFLGCIHLLIPQFGEVIRNLIEIN